MKSLVTKLVSTTVCFIITGILAYLIAFPFRFWIGSTAENEFEEVIGAAIWFVCIIIELVSATTVLACIWLGRQVEIFLGLDQDLTIHQE